MTDYLPFRVRIKLFLRRLLPTSLFETVRSIWIGLFSRFVDDAGLVARYEALFLSKYPPVIQAGPFAGMQYVDAAIGSSYLHKLIGSYEAILHPFIEKIRNKHFDTVLDIGSAEGYYLIGFGLRYPDARLIGFELEEAGRRLNKELYEKNNLTNELFLFEEATAENVAPHITSNTLLICDCEGGEADILDPRLPAFKNIDTAIIELHDFIRPGIKELLTERFKDTHTIEIIRFKLASPEDFPFLKEIKDEKALYELRRERAWQEQEWILLQRRP